MTTATHKSTNLSVLVVDDEQPALDELAFLLERDDRIEEIQTCISATEALKVLRTERFDVVFVDIAMPGLTGLELAEVLAQFRQPPRVVFVTAHEEHAVDAFDLQAVDYVLKPVREERLREAVRRVGAAGAPLDQEETIPVELSGVTRFVARSDVLYVEAHGDYVRLHTATGNHLVRMALTTMEERWREDGFLRIHRSLLVALPHVDEVRVDSGRCSVVVGGIELTVSRRHTPELREMLRRYRQSPG